ncbi:TonB-dependent receptor [Sphingomonas aurantiaca]|uniref:TonB-dependent receptor domain-containing protein n=1 Tax=Sphingomonas aurantiaca TaxID=185949 RepID=UPI002FDFB95B
MPAVDFDIEPVRNVKLRASYSHTITRADYGSLQGGLNIDSNPRIGGGTGSQGNPNLVPFKSKNIDLSAEWYYGPESYISVGYFTKDVKNFIGTTQINTPHSTCATRAPVRVIDRRWRHWARPTICASAITSCAISPPRRRSRA